MNELVLKKLTEIHMRLVQEGELSSPITEMNGVEVYSNRERNYFSFTWAQVAVTIINEKIDEIIFKSFGDWEDFSISDWLEDVEKLTN